jgi:hypothetical protein
MEEVLAGPSLLTLDEMLSMELLDWFAAEVFTDEAVDWFIFFLLEDRTPNTDRFGSGEAGLGCVWLE